MNNIARIIPCKKLPRTMGCFDYLVPERLKNKIKPGDFVYVPFKNRIISGLVDLFTDKSEFSAIKEISDVHNTFAPFLSYQIELIKWFSEYYYYSLGSTLSLFLKEPPKKTAKVKPAAEELAEIAMTGSKSVEKIAEQIMCSKDEIKFLLFPLKQDYKSFFFVKLAKLCLNENKQILVICPQVHKAEELFRCLPRELGERACLFTAGTRTSKNRYFETCRKIRENKISLIIGTRSAIFSPMVNPGVIIIDDAHSEDLKQWDQNPRYDTITVARKIQELSNCKLILSSITPRPEDAWLAKKENYRLISLGSCPDLNYKIINLNEERKKGFTYLSEALVAAIKQTIDQGKKVLLIVNKKGEYGYLACSDCNFEATCQNCKLPLSVFEKKLICYRCGHEQPIILVCPECHGYNLKKLGIGINQIKSELKIIINQEIAIVDEDNVATAKIILSTGQNIGRKVFTGVGLLGLVYVDSLAYLPDFSSSFRLYGFLKELINLFSSNNEPERRLIVQTCFPENIAFSSLAENYEKFYQAEIGERKAFGYPPFARLIKLFFEHHDLAVCKTEAMNLHKKLQTILGRAKDISLTDPYPCYTQKIRKKYRYQMILFMRDCAAVRESGLLINVPEYWTIDKNPNSLL